MAASPALKQAPWRKRPARHRKSERKFMYERLVLAYSPQRIYYSAPWLKCEALQSARLDFTARAARHPRRRYTKVLEMFCASVSAIHAIYTGCSRSLVRKLALMCVLIIISSRTSHSNLASVGSQ
jgi:hypothetical protein